LTGRTARLLWALPEEVVALQAQRASPAQEERRVIDWLLPLVWVAWVWLAAVWVSVSLP